MQKNEKLHTTQYTEVNRLKNSTEVSSVHPDVSGKKCFEVVVDSNFWGEFYRRLPKLWVLQKFTEFQPKIRKSGNRETGLAQQVKSKDFGVFQDKKTTFLTHIETIISELARIFGLKTLYASLMWPNLEYATFIWSAYQDCHSEKFKRILKKFWRFALQRLWWTANP
jgi:hypothetical protein